MCFQIVIGKVLLENSKCTYVGHIRLFIHKCVVDITIMGCQSSKKML